MDTISRENNSMLPVGAIIVGVIALLLGGYSALTLSQVNKRLTDHDTKLGRVETLETSVAGAASAADRASKEVTALRGQTQAGFDTLGTHVTNLVQSVAKIEDSMKKPAPVITKGGAKGGEPAVVGPNEYVVKPGDGGAKIAKTAGVSLSDLQAVNPGVEWTKLKPGQKLKLPAKK
jgi:LysM repeat protein